MFVIQIIFIATIFTLWPTIFACQSSQLVPPISTFPVPPADVPMQRGKLFASARKESGQQHFDKDEEHLFNETMGLVAMNSSASNTTTLAPSLIVSTKMGCTSASVTAVTNQPYNEHTVQADYISLVTKLGLLETFLQVKLSSFGLHVIQPMYSTRLGIHFD
ncbi:hypothetical protein niasHT_037622 [Heterodera trifolii]|uniref:Uncharacterized protein n=1 Tax=Heterodera trifolii TaxID=157864 RepID=A0ABD2IGB9_9BILA